MIDKVNECNPDAIVWDGLDAAIIGISTKGNVVYDVSKIHQIIFNQWLKDDKKTQMDDVIDYVEYNILTAYVGEFTPIHMINF